MWGRERDVLSDRLGRPINIGFLASGNGSSVQKIVERTRDDELLKGGFKPGIIICNKPEGQAGIYDRAKRLGVPIEHEADDMAQSKIFREHNVDLILCLGYTKLVGPEVLNEYERRVLNIHPSLLPKFGGKKMYGLRVHEAVLEAGEEITGATIHQVNSRYDEGRILSSRHMFIPEDLVGNNTPENAQALRDKVLLLEYELMKNTLFWIKSGISVL